MKLPYVDLYMKYVEGIKNFGVPEEKGKVKKKCGLELKVMIAYPSLRRLISGAIAGAVSEMLILGGEIDRARKRS